MNNLAREAADANVHVESADIEDEDESPKKRPCSSESFGGMVFVGVQ